MPDFVDIKQKTGLLPIEYKFYPTNHEVIAQNGGSYTYYFRENKSFSMCLGEKETNGATVLEDNKSGLLRLDENEVNFSVGYWRIVPQNYFSDTFKDNKLIKGKYLLKLNLAQKNTDGANISIQLKDDSNRILYNGKAEYNPEKNESIAPFEIGHSLLHISMTAETKPIDLLGFTIQKE